MRLVKLLAGSFLALLITLPAYAWDETLPNIFVETSGVFANPEDSDNGWIGLQIKPDRAFIELTAVSDFIYRNADLENGLIKNAETGAFSPIRFSLSEVWNIASRDPKVVAVVPIGYLVQEGVPRVAGYFEVKGQEIEELYNAPQLTALYCVSSRAFMEALDFRNFSWQVPYLFAIEYPEGTSRFRTAELEDALVFDLDENRADQPSYFESCRNQIQIGPRILEPRSIGEQYRLKGRKSYDVLVADRRPLTRRTVISWARNNWLSIVSTNEPASLDSIAELLSSESFYNRPTRTCGRGRSISCEFWAAAATSYEHSGLIFRDASGKQFSTGEIDSTIGAALIIRSR